MSQQQTVLRVQTNIPDVDLTIYTGSTTIISQSGITLSGNGTISTPYSGTALSSSSFIIDINDTDCTFYYKITGSTGQTKTIFVTTNGVERTLQTTTGNILSGLTILNVNDTVRFDISGANVVQYVYAVSIPTLSFLYENLDLYSDIPIKINKSIAEIEDIGKKNSDLSIGLSLPGSKKNNRFFETFFNVDSTSLYFSATQRVNINVLLNEQSYFKGYMRLNKVSVMNSKVEYDVTLYSTVGDLFGKIGNNLLQDLDFNDSEYTFNHIFSQTAVGDTLAQSNFFRDSKYPYTYFYPIVHNGYNYVDVSGTTQPDFSGATVVRRTRLYTPTTPISGWTVLSGATAAGTQEFRINSPQEGILDNQLKPALNIYSLIHLIFKTYGYEITSTFFNTPWFKTLYLYGYFSADSTKFGYKLNNIESLPLEGVELIYSGSTALNSLLNIIVCKRGTGVPCFCLDNINYGFANTFPYSEFGTIDSGTSGKTITAVEGFDFGFEYGGVPVADISTLKYAPTSVGSSIAFIDGDPVDFNLVIDQNIKQIDLLSSIAKKFNLIFYPDPNNYNKIIIEPFDFYMGTGTIHDWTPKLSYDKGFTVEPALNFIESTLELTDQDDGDEGNREFKIRNNRIYGRNISYNPTDFKSQDKKIETIFSPELVRQWDNDNVIGLPLGINYAASSQQSTYDNQVRWIYNGVKSKPKLFFWLMGLNPFIDSVGEVYPYRSINTYTVKLQDWSGSTAQSYDRIPSISHTMPMGLADQYKINNDSLSILFNSEETLDNSINLYNTYTENDVYNKFYNNRITNLYDPNTRYLSGYFDLKYSDVQNFNWNDIIKINEQYFIVNKINELNLTNRELTKVDLIQYNVNPQEYPTRYFRYTYCEDLDTCYVLKTDFTNENLLDTNFIWSMYYDNQVGSLTSQTSGFTSTFRIFNETTFLVEYLPYSMEEITEEEYNNTSCNNWELDPNMDYIYTNPNGLQYSLAGFWDAGGNVAGFTGVNVWNNCADFYAAAALYGIRIRGLVPATLFDGKFLTVGGQAFNSGIGGEQYPAKFRYSSNYGQTFNVTSTGSTTAFQSILLNGSRIYRTITAGTTLEYSTDSGTTWSNISVNTGTNYPKHIVTSSSGNTITVIVGEVLSNAYIRQSTNTGTTWSTVSGSNINYISGYGTGYTFLSCGSTGYPVLTAKGPTDRPRPPLAYRIIDNLYIQSTSGSSLTKITNSPIEEYQTGKISDNGQIIVACYFTYTGSSPYYTTYYTYVKSLNGGTSWSTIVNWEIQVPGFPGIAMSADGKYIYLLKYELSPYLTQTYEIYKSDNYGVSFTVMQGPIVNGSQGILPMDFVCSQNGKTLMINSRTSSYNYQVLVSNNYGVSWITHNYNGRDNIINSNAISR